MNTKLIALFAACVALPGCSLLANKAAPAAPAAEAESNEGAAVACTVSPTDLSSGTATATMSVSNEGGWCGLRVTEKDGQPYVLALVRARPEHGRIFVEKAAAKTRVEYTPTAGYVGSDAFTVALRPHAPNTPDATIRVTVMVARPS